MREIKYKVLDKSSQEFISDKGLTLKEIQNINNLDHFEFYEYTGLKDKNGVEIYECDIVNIFGSNTEIEFYEGCFGYWIWKEEKYRNFITATISDKEEIEVIGNTYENEELL